MFCLLIVFSGLLLSQPSTTAAKTLKVDVGNAVRATADDFELIVEPGSTRYQVGDKPSFRVQILYHGTQPVYLVRSVDGSFWEERYPHVTLKIEDPSCGIEVRRYPDCGNLNSLESRDFELILPNTKFEPFSQFDWFPLSRFSKPGTCEFRFEYSTDATELHDWQGNNSSLQVDPHVLDLLGKVPRISLSKTVAVDVADTSSQPLKLEIRCKSSKLFGNQQPEIIATITNLSTHPINVLNPWEGSGIGELLTRTAWRVTAAIGMELPDWPWPSYSHGFCGFLNPPTNELNLRLEPGESIEIGSRRPRVPLTNDVYGITLYYRSNPSRQWPSADSDYLRSKIVSDALVRARKTYPCVLRSNTLLVERAGMVSSRTVRP